MNARMMMVLALSLFAGGAFASSYPTFQQLDADGNGMLIESELDVLDQFRGEDSEFAEADGNNNGSLDSAEYQIWVDLETGSASSDANASDKTSKN